MLIPLFLLTSCEKAILGEDEVNDPENNFEILYNDFKVHYALFGVRGIDWDELYTQYRPRVTAQTSDQELWTILTELIKELDDGHTFLYDGDKFGFYSSADDPDATTGDEYSLELLESKYLERPLIHQTEDEEFSYSKVKDLDIGYIYLGSMDDQDPAWIDLVLGELKQHKALILDIRDNGGGTDSFSARVAGAFADGEHFVYTVQNRNGPGYNDFEAPRKFFTKKEGNESFRKPVMILTDINDASATEIFLLHMKAFEDVVQVGDVTGGDFSDSSSRRFLPNGWEYQYSVQKYLLPDGTSLDGVGHIPDVFIKNTVADIQASQDKVFEKALQVLCEDYNIK